MADVSNVNTATIKDLYERLESLSCMKPTLPMCKKKHPIAGANG